MRETYYRADQPLSEDVLLEQKKIQGSDAICSFILKIWLHIKHRYGIISFTNQKFGVMIWRISQFLFGKGCIKRTM